MSPNTRTIIILTFISRERRDGFIGADPLRNFLTVLTRNSSKISPDITFDLMGPDVRQQLLRENVLIRFELLHQSHT